MSECEKMKIGKEFLAHHKWPVALSKKDHDRCYCRLCYLPSKSDTFKVGGHTYVIPRGWTRFGVYVDEPFARHHHVWKSWANCFHGTSIENAKSIVEHRQLLLPRDMTLDGKKLQIREGHIPGEYFFFTTPTIKYAALDCYAHTYNFVSSTTGKHYTIKVALQCKQKPDSFIIQPETVGARQKQQTICPIVSNDEMEWKTQHRASIMPYGLMLEIQDADHISETVDNKTKTKQQVTCPNCNQENVWSNGGYMEGQDVICFYATCKKKFQQVTCPNCSGSNFWKNGDYQMGMAVACGHTNCKKKFQQIICPHCSGSIIWKNADYQEGSTTTCPYDNCKRTFQAINCPHCFGCNTCKNNDYTPGAVTTCAHENCKKKFQKAHCPSCSGVFVWKDANYTLGSTFTCPHENCKKSVKI